VNWCLKHTENILTASHAATRTDIVPAEINSIPLCIPQN
jgi:hypothetical protein